MQGLRKQIRQMPYLRSTACGLPQMEHLVYALVENFAGLCCLFIIDFFAILLSPYLLKGIPSALKSSLASSSVFAVVYEAYIHAAYLFNLVVLDLGEDELFLYAHAVVAPAVEAVRGNAAESRARGEAR